MDCSTLINRSGIKFGTSGARGLVNEFTDEVCFAFTLAFLSTQVGVSRISLAIDNRPSSPRIAKACISAAKSIGVEVDYYGVIPTPALAYVAQQHTVPAIMVTGSHIPFDRNGLKFYTKSGEITKQDEVAIINAKASFNQIELRPLPYPSKYAFESYLTRYLDVFSSDLLRGKKIGVYQHSSAGRELYPKLFEALGAEVVCLGYSDEFVPIDTEAVADSDREQAKEWSKTYSLDAIFSTDGDGDRPLLADENGEYFTGDTLCLLAAKSLGVEVLAVPVSCTTNIERSLYFKKVIRTKIGSPYVIDAFSLLKNNSSAVAGFEANGGFLLASNVNTGFGEITALATRDAVLPVLAILKLAENNPLSSVTKNLPNRVTYSDRLKAVDAAKSRAIIQLGKESPNTLLSILKIEHLEITSRDLTDGLRLTLSSGDILHLRPSGNAPELRCYAESNSKNNASELVLNTLESIRVYLHAQK